MPFTHLHVHTEYSLLDGAARITNLVAEAKELGMDALAITDHGVMFGVVDFYRECKKQGIKPILGCEVYTAARTMADKDVEKDKYQGHLLLLAKNQTGYENLMKIVSYGYTEGFYYKPRVDKQLLRRYSEGIIATSACLAGDVQRMLSNGDYAGAKKEALEYLEIFGEGNYYLELQDQGLEEEFAILDDMKRLREETGIPFVATNDVHYVRQEDAGPHDVLLCIQTGKTVEDEDRMRFPNDQFYLKSPEEMEKLFADIPEAISNTEAIARQCNVELDFSQIHLPEFSAPDGLDNKSYLRKLCQEGAEMRYGAPLSQELADRLEYELSTIESMGYVEYFLIVWDFINFAKNKKIVVGPGRGSAAGSIVAYSLRITDIDPVKYGLIFERFLNPERISMPDIDIDFCYERRGEVIDYVVEKYGQDKVAQIITFGTMKAKQAIRDVGRAMNIPYGEVDAIAKKVPFDLKMTLDKALNMNPELKADYERDNRIRQLLDTAKALEGMPRHASTHAAGVVISKKSLNEYVPLYLADKSVSTQFPMTTIEELGLLKMDFLGLRNLTVIRNALELIEENHGVQLDFETMEYDDPAIYELISSGNTLGVFQLESSGMRSFMQNLQPDCFEDIVAGISLYRPGPMASIPTYIENKKNLHKIKYVDKSLEPILSVTYGCMVYQEQVMQIVRDLAGYTYGRSDLVRRAMSKKKRDVMEQEREYFIYGKEGEDGELEIRGCVRNGISEKAASDIYGQMITFAEYAFNKSHAAAYAVIAYQTAFLKVHYPIEFMAALMTSVMGDSNQVAKYIRNCKEMGIEVLPPDVLESGKKFTVRDGKIRFGLMGVKNVGEGIVDAVGRMIKEKGRPEDIFTFVNNIDIHELNKKAVESLIKAGAFDCFNENRAAHLSIYERLIESAQNDSRKNIAGQLSLFQSNSEVMQEAVNANRLPLVANFSKELLMSMEKEMLGVYITGHPLDDYAEKIKEIETFSTEELLHAEESNEIYDNMQVTIAGIITNYKTLVTKKNNMMAFVQLEDLYGSIELIVFPNIFELYRGLLREDAVVAVSGKVNFKEDEAPKILADQFAMLEDYTPGTFSTRGRNNGGYGNTYGSKGYSGVRSDGQGNKPYGDGQDKVYENGHREEKRALKINIPKEMDQKETLNQVKDILQKHRGDTPVILVLEGLGKRLKAGPDLWVDDGKEFKDDMAALLGDGSLNFQ